MKFLSPHGGGSSSRSARMEKLRFGILCLTFSQRQSRGMPGPRTAAATLNVRTWRLRLHVKVPHVVLVAALQCSKHLPHSGCSLPAASMKLVHPSCSSRERDRNEGCTMLHCTYMSCPQRNGLQNFVIAGLLLLNPAFLFEPCLQVGAFPALSGCGVCVVGGHIV